MKQFLIVALAGVSMLARSQNLVQNGDFEAAPESYTVAEDSKNVLKRVVNIYDATNDVTFPTAAATAVSANQWVKRALAAGDDLAKAVVVNTGAKSGTYALNLKIGVLATAGYDKYINMVASQKLESALDNTKKYVVSFWAKPDATEANNCGSVTVMLVENTLKQVLYPLAVTVQLTSKEWTKYSVVLDIPIYKTFYPTVDFSTAFLGFGISTTYTNDSPAFTNYSGVLLDDISMTEYTGPVVRYVKTGGTGDGSSWQNAASDINKVLNEITRGEVRVAAGQYFVNTSVNLKDSVFIMGAYAAQGSNTRDLANNKTILDGGNNKRIVLGSEQGAPFYYGSKLDGFILQRGNSDFGSAARLTLGCVLENCIIRNNVGNGTVGAAVYFSRNLRVPSISQNKNYQNTGALINCLIINNTSSGGAGAVYDAESTLCSVINCVIAKNECTEPSVGTGGFYIGKSSQWVHLQNNIFYRNSGATTALNNIRNNSTTNVYAILNNWFDNSTMPVVFTTDTRSICKDNKTSTNIATPDFVMPTSFIGATSDATLIEEMNGSNWRLKATSGLIGLGSSTQGIRYPYENMNQNNVSTQIREFTAILTDIEGNPRIVNSTVDMGAYEFNPFLAVYSIEEADNQLFATVLRDELKIRDKGILQIISVGGILVVETFVDNSTLRFDRKGVYVLRLKSGNMTRVQKLINQ